MALHKRFVQARSWRARLDSGEFRTKTALAEELGISMVRVCQVVRLLDLAPEIVEELEDLAWTGPVPPEKKLYRLAQVRPQEAQLPGYRRLCAEESVQGRRSTVASVRRTGLQHLFHEARRWQAMLDGRKARSLEDIARREGISRDTVAQTILLLHLHPEIVLRLDVPTADRPPGLRIKALRSLARMRDLDEQLRRFDAMLLEGQLASESEGGESVCSSSQLRPIAVNT